MFASFDGLHVCACDRIVTPHASLRKYEYTPVIFDILFIYLCKFRLAYESDTSRRDDMWHLSHLFDFRSASLPDCAQNFPLFLCKCLLFVMATNILLHVWPEVEWLRKNYELRQYKSQVNNDTIRLISTSSSVYCCLQLLLSLSLDFFFIFIT